MQGDFYLFLIITKKIPAWREKGASGVLLTHDLSSAPFGE